MTSITVRFQPLLYSVFPTFGRAEEAQSDADKVALIWSAASRGSTGVGSSRVRAPLPLA